MKDRYEAESCEPLPTSAIGMIAYAQCGSVFPMA